MSGLLVSGQPPATRAIAEANDSFSRLQGALSLVPEIGRTVVPDGWMPWLLRNAGLQALMPYVDWATLWDKGPAWLRLRGTPAASVEALSWIGWDIRFEDGAIGTSLYDHYHIHLDRVPWRAELEQLIPVERFAKSTDSKFFRLVHGLDLRPVRTAHTRLGRAILGRHSGIDVRPDWPRLSFTQHETMTWPSTTQARSAERLTVTAHASLRGDVIFGRSKLATRSTRGPHFGLQLSDTIVAPANASHRAAETLRPVAGIVGGRSILGRRQALFVAMRKVFGERPVVGSYRLGGAFRLPAVVQLMKVPEPIRLEAGALIGIEHRAFETLTDHTTATSAASAAIGVSGNAAIAANADLGDAPWSGLPWSDDPWGAAPRALATETEN